jgi:hypothetical protein
MSKLNEIIKELKEIRGKKVYFWGKYHTGPTFEEENGLVDSVDIAETLMEIEVDSDELADEIIEAWENDSDELEEFRAENTYNSYGNITNDMHYTHVRYKGLDYIMVQFHLYGDIRGNYTDFAVLSIDDEMDFYDLMLETNINITITVNNVDYEVQYSAMSEGYEVFLNNGQHLETFYDWECLKDDIKELNESEEK